MNDMAIMILLLAMVFVILLVGVFVLKKAMIVTDPGAEKALPDEEINTAQDFIPIGDIKDSMICLGDYRYRAVIECSSVNYMLKTEKEREIIEQSFKRFISSITFPISFHIQTRAIDNTEIVRALEEDILQINMSNKLMSDYARMYLDSMRSFDAYIGNAKQKKKYIIIGYEDAHGLTELNDAEKEEHSRHQLQERVEFVRGQLTSIGIKSERLDNQGLIELLYRTYHREDVQYDMVQAVSQGQFMNSIVVGDVKSDDISAEQRIDLELIRVQKLIQEEYLDLRLGRDSAKYQKMADIYNNIEQIRTLVDKPYGGELKIVEAQEKVNKPLEQKNETSLAKENEVVNTKSFEFDSYEDEKDENFGFSFEDKKESKEEEFNFEFDSYEDEKDEDFGFSFEDKKESKEEEFSFEFDGYEDEKDEDFEFSFEDKLDEIFDSSQDDDIVISKRTKKY